MEKPDLLAEQYADASNLSTRGEFNRRYTVADRHPHEWVLDQISLPAAATMLDIGCGPATFWSGNPDRVPEESHVVLADFSRGMVGQAREAVTEAPFSTRHLTADAERLPFADGVFDRAFALQMLYHLPDREAGLAECARVLADDGRFYATTSSQGNMGDLFEMMSTVADGAVDPLPGGFTAENGREVLGDQFDSVERYVFENELRVDDPDALVAYALSLPLDAAPLAAFDPADAGALREEVARRINRDGEIRLQKDMALFVADP
jgi:ubiquinone/menaquinone biosynthesis C-methylase UbiE